MQSHAGTHLVGEYSPRCDQASTLFSRTYNGDSAPSTPNEERFSGQSLTRRTLSRGGAGVSSCENFYQFARIALERIFFIQRARNL